MKVIDLLNKIANREEFPKKIKYGSRIYECEDGFDFMSDNLEHPYFAENYCNDYEDLNSEVEIIEEDKKIEKLEKYYDDALEEYIVETYINGVNYKEIFKSKYDEMMINKINEIIDYINKEVK